MIIKSIFSSKDEAAKGSPKTDLVSWLGVPFPFSVCSHEKRSLYQRMLCESCL